MRNCRACGGSLVPTPLRNHRVEQLGLEGGVIQGVVIAEGAHALRCEHCHKDEVVLVINMEGLLAAVALNRVNCPARLVGHEVHALRMAVGLSAKDFAELVGCTPATVWNWENNKTLMGISDERVLRLRVAREMHEKAPLIDFDPVAIEKMQLQPVRSAEGHVLVFTLAFYKQAEQWAEARKAA